MSARRLYAAVVYLKHGQRKMEAVSHSIKALRRQHPNARIFAVEATSIPGSQYGLKEYVIVGKEIPEVYERIVKFAHPGTAAPLGDSLTKAINGESAPSPIDRAHSYRRRYRRQTKRENAA